ncbi:SAM hydrolase/SAM-dependent halogenase family protein [Chitinophaga sp. 22620]|uniref:SAM hydrolase/SAM-dependent halogenase family protein n=1 Tax=Chitinophaga sp. 22620 TaxID=3453952 RepID=UPI003F866115
MPIITLTSDIGLQDYLTGAIKGLLLQHCADAQVVDISHHISPFNLPQATYICRSAFRYFPDGTYHLVLNNLFDRKADYLLLGRHNNQFILCADNGLLTMIAGEMPAEVYRIPLDPAENRNTLNMVAVMARALARLTKGAALSETGTLTSEITIKNNLQPLTGEDYIEGQILHIDNFENVVVNITRGQFDEQRRNRKFAILFRRDEMITQISETYADVPEGQKLALFNSAGYLEIAVNKGNAAGLFGLQGFRRDQLQQGAYQQLSFYQTVRILFE